MPCPIYYIVLYCIRVFGGGGGGGGIGSHLSVKVDFHRFLISTNVRCKWMQEIGMVPNIFFPRDPMRIRIQ